MFSIYFSLCIVALIGLADATCASTNINFDSVGACVGISTYILLIIVGLFVLLILCCCCSSLRNNFWDAIIGILTCPCACFGFISGDQESALVYNSNTSRFCMIFFISFSFIIASLGVIAGLVFRFATNSLYSQFTNNFNIIGYELYDAANSTAISITDTNLLWLTGPQLGSLGNLKYSSAVTTTNFQKYENYFEVLSALVFGIPFIFAIPYVCLAKDLGSRQTRKWCCCCYIFGAVFYLTFSILFIVLLVNFSSISGGIEGGNSFFIPTCTDSTALSSIKPTIVLDEPINCVKLDIDISYVCSTDYFICPSYFNGTNYLALQSDISQIITSPNTTGTNTVPECAENCSGLAQNYSWFILNTSERLIFLANGSSSLSDGLPCSTIVANSTPKISSNTAVGLAIILFLSASIASMVYCACAISTAQEYKEIFFEANEVIQNEPIQRTRTTNMRIQRIRAPGA